MSDGDYYRVGNVPVFEAIYGPGLISMGGYAAVDEMVSGLDLQGKRLLDIGSGIGGIAHYLAAQYGARVCGLEIPDWMATYALDTAPADIQTRVDFVTYDDQGRIPLPEGSIDLAYSKGVLTNVEDKKSLFEDVARVLRPGGQICLIDWLAPAETGQTTERLPLGDLSHQETAASYETLLSSCGFSDISFEDLSASYLRYVTEIEARLADPAHIEEFGAVLNSEFREAVIASHAATAQEIREGRKLSTRILATLSA